MRGPGTPVALGLVAAVGLLLLVMQVVSADTALDPATLFSARGADRTIALNAALAVLTLVLAATLPRRRAWLALVPAAALATLLLGAATILGGHLPDMAVAVLTATCAWQVGRWIVLAAGSPRLAEIALVDLVVGIGALGILITLLGRVGLLRWWGIGLFTAAIGAVGAYAAARRIYERRGALVEAVTTSRLAIVCAGLLALQVASIAVWVSAPEIMFDAVYAKAWLPQVWAQTGSIDPLIAFPVLNNAGFAQLLAVPGHALGGPDVGRYLQLLAWLGAVAGVWAWGRRLGSWGPVAAVVVGVSPHFVWQAATAYDDLILALAAFALAVAVFESVTLPDGERAGRTALVLGLLAGTCISLKVHLAALALALLAGWVLLGVRDRTFARRVAGGAAGTLLVGAPPLIVRWIELDNPLFPSYNDIFHSKFFPPINTPLNFPFWPDAGLRGALTWMWEAVTHPTLMNEATPPGAFGLLVGALFVAFVIGWRRSANRAAPVVWVALVAATILWWVTFRYLRYLLPPFLVAMALVLVQAGARAPRRATGGALAVAVTVLVAASLPATISLFWNVPQRKLPYAAAFGRWDARDYRRHVFSNLEALEAYERAAPPGALAIVTPDGAQRLLVDGRDLSPSWEVGFRFLANGTIPAAAADGLRRLREKGVGWALVSGAERALSGAGYLPGVLREHGEIVFADRGWDLYRLVDRPRNGRTLRSCDARLRGRPNCWAGELDRTPGLTYAEAPAGVARVVPVCGGQTVGVRPAVAPAGQPSAVSIDFDGRDPLLGLQQGGVAPGTSTPVFATAPADARTATINVFPGAGGEVRTIDLAVKGGCAPGA